jgi:hypothetical protein
VWCWKSGEFNTPLNKEQTDANEGIPPPQTRTEIVPHINRLYYSYYSF